MRIGLDFDNTIACYDSAIARLAENMFDLPSHLPRTKLGVRDYLRGQGRESDWTIFQGELYGPGMQYAEVYQGALETMLLLSAEGHELFIISHRSKTPYAGPSYDLHEAARCWVKQRLQSHGLFSKDQVYFLESKNEKVRMIGMLGCELFLDDLPEVLEDADFPLSTRGILFAPDSRKKPSSTHFTTSGQWTSLPPLLTAA